MHQALDAGPSKGSELAGTLEVKVTLNQRLTLKCPVLNLLLPPGPKAKRTAMIHQEKIKLDKGYFLNVA